MLGYGLCLIAFYLALIRIFRYRRRDHIIQSHGFRRREDLQHMDLKTAHAIVRDLAELEFPKVFAGSVFFALFKTYGIPSISRLLLSTGQLSSPATASKRAADTGVLLVEMILNDPFSDRAVDAVARVNYLHGRYRGRRRRSSSSSSHGNEISDQDMLYTLGLFALEPARWAAAYDWRPLTDVERCALGVFWRHMGAALEIPVMRLLGGHLPAAQRDKKKEEEEDEEDEEDEKRKKEEESDDHQSDDHHHDATTDGLDFLSALSTWCAAYERRHMAPSPSNREVAGATLDIALFHVPGWLRPLGLQVVAALLEPRLRRAVMLRDPGRVVALCVAAGLVLRRWAVRYLCLPRPRWARVWWFSEDGDDEGEEEGEEEQEGQEGDKGNKGSRERQRGTKRYHALRYIAHPWYVKPTFWSRWGFAALRTRVWGGVLPGDGDQGGREYRPDGYRLAELGPEGLRGKGEGEMRIGREKLRGLRRGCPVGF